MSQSVVDKSNRLIELYVKRHNIEEQLENLNKELDYVESEIGDCADVDVTDSFEIVVNTIVTSQRGKMLTTADIMCDPAIKDAINILRNQQLAES